MTRHRWVENPLELMSQPEAEALAQRVFTLIDEPKAAVLIGHYVEAGISVARGDAHTISERGGVYVQLQLDGCSAGTTQVDDDGLRTVIQLAREAAGDLGLRQAPWAVKEPITIGARPKTFFEATAGVMDMAARTDIVRQALDATEQGDLIGAGDLAVNTNAYLAANTSGFRVYSKSNYAEFSLTARTKDGKGSGWGWTGHNDWSRADPKSAIARAVDLAQRAANPVAVEPGRYTVILEPTALASLLDPIWWSAFQADQGATTFSKRPVGTNKIGLQVLDRRLQVVGDPWDADMPYDIVDEQGNPVQKTTWITDGVLQELDYDPGYAAVKGRQPTFGSNGFRWFGKGQTQTLEEMIASTKRGIWVNRVSSAFPMNRYTQLMTGTTRDGTFLIENGKITKAVKNFRFTESPFFVLNKLEAFGEPERAMRNMIVPRVKVRDFDFTSLTDAV